LDDPHRQPADRVPRARGAGTPPDARPAQTHEPECRHDVVCARAPVGIAGSRARGTTAAEADGETRCRVAAGRRARRPARPIQEEDARSTMDREVTRRSKTRPAIHREASRRRRSPRQSAAVARQARLARPTGSPGPRNGRSFSVEAVDEAAAPGSQTLRSADRSAAVRASQQRAPSPRRRAAGSRLATEADRW